MKLRHLITSLVLLCGCPDGSAPAAGPGAPQPIAVELLPFLEEAAGMSPALLDEIASAPTPPHPEEHEVQSLTLFLLFGVPYSADPPAGFKPLGEGPPSPLELVKLIDRTRGKGYVSVLNEADVTQVSGVKDDQGVVRGTVECRNAHYALSADYVARTHEGSWLVTEFDVPEVGKVARDAAGVWKIVSRADAPQPTPSGE